MPQSQMTQPLDFPSDIIRTAYEKAKQVSKNAYAKYSNYEVGSCIVTKSGQFFVGANVENLSYPMAQCAEASAMGAMVAAGCYEIAAVVVYNEKSTMEKMVTPCGGCRQKLSEFSAGGTEIFISNEKGLQARFLMKEMLPFSFSF